MPELPEVETTRRGIAPHISGQIVREVVVRNRRLRWPVPARLARELPGQTIRSVERRGKYLLLRCAKGTVIIHLGMSGSLRIVPAATAPGSYDHVDLVLANGNCLRLRDARRFGAMLWTSADPLRHKLLKDLGPEPLADELNGDYLYERSRGRGIAVKLFLMDSRIVAGLGNIYVNEALFRAGIHPLRAAGRISRARYRRLAQAIKRVLRAALRAGGTTLRDFASADGRPGYFKLKLRVYGRAGLPCTACGRALHRLRQGQRSTYYCRYCQR